MRFSRNELAPLVQFKGAILGRYEEDVNTPTPPLDIPHLRGHAPVFASRPFPTQSLDIRGPGWPDFPAPIAIPPSCLTHLFQRL